MNKGIENPCYQCNDRNADCHSICGKYASWKHEHEQRKEKLRNDSETNRIIDDYYNSKRRSRYRK